MQNNIDHRSRLGQLAIMYVASAAPDTMRMQPSIRDCAVEWITRGLPGGEDKTRHPCWECAQAKVPYGVLIPFLLDVTESYEGAVSFLVSTDGIYFAEDGKPLLSIDSFALYCHTGTSQKLHTHLEVTLYTIDDAKSVHRWTSVVPKPSFGDRRRGGAVLDPEVRRLFDNNLYSPMTRDILRKLMQHLCIGSAKIQRNAETTSRAVSEELERLDEAER